MTSTPIGVTKQEGKKIIEAAKNQLRNLISKQLSETSSGNVVKRNLFPENAFVSQADASKSLESIKSEPWEVTQLEDCGPSTSRQCYSTSFKRLKPLEKPWAIETISSSDSDAECEAISKNLQFNSDSSKQKIISHPNQESFVSDDDCEAIMVNIVNSSSSKQKTISHPSVKDSSEKRKSQKPNKSASGVEKLCWVNFLTHLLEIQNNVNLWNLFIPQDIAIFNSFVGLSTEAQKVYVQLLNSDYSWRRVSTLKYPEIGVSLDPILHILIETNFLTSDISRVEIIALLDLLSLSDLKSLCKSFYLRDDGNKELLTKSLIDFCNNKEISPEMNGNNIIRVVRERILSYLGMVVKLAKEPKDLFMRTMLLYSLPHSRSMKPDGRIPLLCSMKRINEKKTIYPTYPLKPLQNFFGSRESLLRFQNALELEANIREIVGVNIDKLLELYTTAMSNFIAEAGNIVIRKEVSKMPLHLRMFTAGTVLAEAILFCQKALRKKKMYYEMIRSYQLLLDQDTYLTSCHGLCYEQLALIYHQYIKDIPKAVNCLIEALTDSTLTPTDRVLLSNRGLLITNQKKKRKADNEQKAVLASMLIFVNEPPKITLTARSIRCNLGKKTSVNYVYETEEGIGQIMSSMKEIVLLHHKQMGFDQGIHPKDSLGTSIFGMLFWDIIYSCDVPNVFICPYQSRPLDLNTSDFYKNRKELIEKRLREIEGLWSWDEIENQVRKVWLDEKSKESVVSWASFENLKQLEDILDCINRDVLAKICSKLAKEFTTSHKGFPPIFIWNQATRKCKFIKVVEPSMEVSVFEKFWFSYLASIGADVAVCYVETTGDKLKKRKSDIADNTDALDILS